MEGSKERGLGRARLRAGRRRSAAALRPLLLPLLVLHFLVVAPLRRLPALARAAATCGRSAPRLRFVLPQGYALSGTHMLC